MSHVLKNKNANKHASLFGSYPLEDLAYRELHTQINSMRSSHHSF